MTDDKCFLSLGIMYNRDYCDIIFIQKDYLGVHTHFKHEEITFILTYVAWIPLMKIMLRSTSNICDQCHGNFIQKDNLVVHKPVIHDGTNFTVTFVI